MEDGAWKMEDGGRKMEDGRCIMEDGAIRHIFHDTFYILLT